MDKFTQILILPIIAFLVDLLVVSPILEAPHPIVLMMQAGLITPVSYTHLTLPTRG